MGKEKVNILIVDDRPENIAALEAVLNNPGYRLVSASSGQEALRQVLIKDFAVILLDVQMPGMNGFDTAKLIKSREKSRHIPIVFVTAISQATESVLLGYACGAIDYVFKPFQPEALKLKIKGLVEIYQNQQKLKLERTREIMEVKEHFRTIFESSPGLIAIRTLQGGCYISVNESWIRHTGYSWEEIQNQNTNVLKFRSNSTAVEQLNRCPDLLDYVHNMHVCYTTKAGEEREGLLSTKTIIINGEKCVISMITDITEKILLERKMTKLDRLNLIGEMAAGIAHEIRNPMTTVRGFLQMSRNRPITAEDADLMIEELDRANTIISEFLALAKSKRTDRKLHSLNAIIQTLHPLIQAEALRSDKHLVLELGRCPMLLLDQKEIRQLILNIALNGLESMTAGGKLTIKTCNQGNKVALVISDEGHGIPNNLLDKIGTPFFTTKDHGTGLGLAVSYSVAARHEALIDVKTSKKGTAFSIKFSLPEIISETAPAVSLP